MSDPGYGFVPLPPKVRRIEREQARWDRRVPGTLAGLIDIELVTEQPVHIGSGSKHAQQREVVLRGARVRGGPGIPGSSFKGVLRARYEAITLSCAGPAPKPRGDGTFKIRSSTHTEVKNARLRASSPALETNADRCTPERACPACALFGRMSLRSRITVTDLACTDGVELKVMSIPERFGPNLHHIGPARLDASGRVFEVHNLHGRKFGRGRGPASENRLRVEAIPAGASLTGQLRLFNVTPAELGGLFVALGCEPASALKLGGGKAHGFGRLRCKARYQLTGFGTLAPPLTPSAWYQQFRDSDDQWVRGVDTLVALHRGDC